MTTDANSNNNQTSTLFGGSLSTRNGSGVGDDITGTTASRFLSGSAMSATTESYFGGSPQTGMSDLSNRTSWFADSNATTVSGSGAGGLSSFFNHQGVTDSGYRLNVSTTAAAAGGGGDAGGVVGNHSFYLNDSLVLGSNSSVYWCQNESAQPHDEDFYEFYETAQFVTGLILYPCICIPGLMGNFLTLLVLSDRNLRTSTNAFLSALAVADSIKLINDLLYFCTILLLRTDDDVGNRAYGYLYPYAHFIFSMSVCVSSWLTVSVAVERYIMVCHPTRARDVCNRGRAVAVCTAVFVVMTTLALPSALRYKTVQCVRRDTQATMLQVELTEMWKNETFVLAYNWCQNLLRSIIPLLVLVVLNTCITRALRKTRANKKNNARHKVTVMMIIVILVFLVCITPDAIMSTVFGLGYTEASNLVKGIREFTDTLLGINAATNFIIYCLFNRMFLDSCKSLFCKTSSSSVKKKKWHTELDESQYKRLSDGQKSQNNSNNNGSPPRL